MLTTMLACLLSADPLAHLPQSDQKALSLLGPDVILQSNAAEPIIDPTNWFPLQDAANTFVRTSGNGAGREEIITLKGNSAASSGWTQKDPTKWTRYLKPTAAEIRVPASINVSEAVVSRYAPAQPLVLGNLKPGVSVSESIAVKVYDLHDTSTVAYTGSLRMTYQDLGSFRIKVPAGTYDTRLIKIAYDGKVGPASVQDASWIFYASGVGPVAFVNHKDISAMLFYNKDRRFGAVLQSRKLIDDASKSTRAAPPLK
jgi:hypothetical protein